MKKLFIAQTLALAIFPLSPCLAQEYIYAPIPSVERTTTTTIEVTKTPDVPVAATSTEVIVVPRAVNYKFKERLSNLQLQIDNGLNNGWLSVGQAAAFSAERSRLLSATNDAEFRGWPKGQTDLLEKDVTAFSASVTSSMNRQTASKVIIYE